MIQRVAIVAALEREVAPLVKGWSSTVRAHQMRAYRIFERDRIALVCGGVGAVPARRAAEAIVASFTPQVLISAGFAGATSHGMQVGDPLTAATVVDAAGGKRYSTQFGLGVLATVHSTAGPGEKAELLARFGAHAVDMEAAGVAEVAELNRLSFLAVKAISDLPDFQMPPVQQFIGPDGEFETGRLVAFAAFRPVLWRQLRELAANSARASETLCRVLGSVLQHDDLTRLEVHGGRLQPVTNP